MLRKRPQQHWQLSPLGRLTRSTPVQDLGLAQPDFHGLEKPISADVGGPNKTVASSPKQEMLCIQYKYRKNEKHHGTSRYY